MHILSSPLGVCMEPALPADPEPNYKVVSLVTGSPALWAVLQALVANPRGITQRAISQIAKVSQGHMSEHLAKLAELGLAKCLEPHVRKGKLYTATPEGRAVTAEVQRIASLEKERTVGGMKVGNQGPV